MRQATFLALGSLLAAVALQLVFAGTAFAGAGDDHPAGTLAKTTAKTVKRAEHDAKEACKKADHAAEERDKAQAQLDKAKNPEQRAALQALLDKRTAEAAEAAAACAVATDNAEKEAASLAGVNGGPTSDAGAPALADVHNTAAGAVSDNDRLDLEQQGDQRRLLRRELHPLREPRLRLPRSATAPADCRSSR